MLPKVYLLAKFGFDTAENEPAKIGKIWRMFLICAEIGKLTTAELVQLAGWPCGAS